MKLRSAAFAATIGFSTLLLSCEKDEAISVQPPSGGRAQSLSGGTGGANAVNSVFLDLSTDWQDSVLRSSWDLGFYTGAEFRVVLNHTTAALGKVLDKNDLTQVGAADTIGLNLAMSQTAPSASEFAMLDHYSGNISQTLIPAISATDAENKVIIINRGTGGATAPRRWKKIRVLRNASGGYTLQHANITDASFQSIQIAKDAAYNFSFVSFDAGAVNVEPKKDLWDLQWTYSVYKTSFGAGDVPYNFSDLVLINHLGGVQAAEVLTSTASYADYSEANIATTTFSSNRWTIGSNWRSTTGTVGVKTDRFYVIKDGAGHVYKIKFVSFHPSDGGVRGYPVIESKLVKN